MGKGESPKKKKKKHKIELTYPSMFLWGFFLFFLLGWIFILGILVGRGLLPGPVTAITGLKDHISKLPGVAGSGKTQGLKSQNKSNSDPKLVFYEKLSVKKEEAKKKWVPERKKSEPLEKPEKPENPEKPRQIRAPPVDNAQYTVQIASLEDQNMAQKLIGELTSRGYPAYFYEAKVDGRIYYRIRCGRFVSRGEADDYAIRLATETGHKGFVSKLE